MIEEKEIPAVFVWRNLTEYQKQTIKLKWNIFNLYYKYRIEKKMKEMDACNMISEDVSKELDTVFRLNKQIQKAMEE